MQKTILPLFVGCALALLPAACAGTAERGATDRQPPATPAASSPAAGAPSATPQNEIVRVRASEVRVAAGQSAEASVTIEIAGGYHANANPASDKFYIPTQVQVAPAGGINPGKPVYPAALTKKFAFSEKPLAVYEGEVRIRLPLSAGGAAAKGRHMLPAKVVVQPCDDEKCLPPRTLETSIPVTVE